MHPLILVVANGASGEHDAVVNAIRSALPSASVVVVPGGAIGDAISLPTLRQMEREQIVRALAVTAGRRAAAARLLGISERNLYRKIRAYALGA